MSHYLDHSFKRLGHNECNTCFLPSIIAYHTAECAIDNKICVYNILHYLFKAVVLKQSNNLSCIPRKRMREETKWILFEANQARESNVKAT